MQNKNYLYFLVFIVFFLEVKAGVSEINVHNFKNMNSEDSTYFINDEFNIAYHSFNNALYDPVRKLYYRDTKQGKDVAAIWTQAIYWDMAMNAYKADPIKQNKQLIEDIYLGCYNYYAGFDWYNYPDVWFIYDDIMWWVISMARAYELTGEGKYLAHSVSGFNRVWYGIPGLDIGSYDPIEGGMFWDWTMGRKGKMACINYPTVIASLLLYNITNDKAYLNKAKDVYDWSRNNLFNKETGEVADSKHGHGEPHWKSHTYNQGTCIGAAVELYRVTKEETYLSDAVLAADFTRNQMSSRSQVLPFDKGEEQGIYHAIFGQYVVKLAHDCNKPEYLNWLHKNISLGWQNRDRNRNLTTRDFSKKVSDIETISSYDASGIVGIMLAIASLQLK